jgi:hypothetical protein
MEKELYAGADPRVFVTDPEEPEEGRVFVEAKARWYERIEGEMGNVAFSHIADSEEDLREWLSQAALLEEELAELDDEYARIVQEEFSEQAPLYPEAPELSDEEPFQEQEPGPDSGPGW